MDWNKVGIAYTGGLGENPEIAGKPLKKHFEELGATVVFTETSGVIKFKDRVFIAKKRARQMKKDFKHVFMVGCSSGGLATHMASIELSEIGKQISGVVLLSPAIPFGKIFITKPLLKILLGKIGWDMLRGKTIIPPRGKYASLVEPLADDMREEILSSRTNISGLEARELALCPPSLTKAVVPTLHMWGGDDRWIQPSAQMWFNLKLQKQSKVMVIRNKILGEGHLLLASEERNRALEIMRIFFEGQSIRREVKT